MTNKLVRFALAVLAIACVQAQPAPQFAAASVKVNRSNDPRMLGIEFLPGGKLKVENVPLFMIVAAAYDVPFQSKRLTGGPAWIGSERFDIDATPEPGAIPAGATKLKTDELVRAMLRKLLAERFGLKMRSEMKDQPVYAIVVGKDGPKMKPSSVHESDCGTPAANGIACHQFNGGRGRGLHAKAASMADLALFVANWTDRPLIDKTGLAGMFEFETRGWSSMTPGPAPAPGAVAEDGQDAASIPTVFTIFTDLGLKLESQKAPIEMFTIESVQKPSEN